MAVTPQETGQVLKPAEMIKSLRASYNQFDTGTSALEKQSGTNKFFSYLTMLSDTGVTQKPEVASYLKLFSQNQSFAETLKGQFDPTANAKAQQRTRELLELVGISVDVAMVPAQPSVDPAASPKKGWRGGRRALLKTAGAVAVGAYTGTRLAEQRVDDDEWQRVQSPDASINRFNDLIRPLIETAFNKRAERAAQDPEYSKRVDKELNSTKVNFLLFGYSEEDDETYADQGGSIGFMSYDMRTGVVSSVGITRETFVPRMRGMHYTIRGQDYGNRVPIIRYVYKAGGFDLMREVAEEATGLAVDYQMVMKDKVLYDLVNEFVGQVEVDVVKEADTIPFKFNQREYDNDSGGMIIEKGRQKMNAIEFMRYILAGDKVNVAGKENQRPGRKNAAIKALKEAVLGKLGQDGVGGLIQLANFVRKEFDRGDLKVDFDMGIMKDVIGVLGRFSMHKLTRQPEAHIPESAKDDLLLNDEFFGDKGTMRVHRLKDNPNEYLAAPKSIQKMVDDMREAQAKMIEQGINYDDHDKGLEAIGVMPVWMQVPINGDPDTGDFRDYWKATRELVKARLSSG